MYALPAGYRVLERLDQESEGLKAFDNLLRPIVDFADDDEDAVCGEGECACSP
jgi:hypothetical protein